ncbi:MAG: hypothetical protein ABI051_15830 [Vicinamibacterales bacterium]
MSSGLALVKGAEMNVAYSVTKLLLGGQLYGDPDLPPFDITQYSPGYYFLAAWVCKLLGVQALDTTAVVTTSRGVSLALALTTCAGAGVLLRKTLRVPLWISIVGCASIACVILPWSYLARPDALVDLLVFAAFWCGLEATARGANRRWVLTAGALALVAGLAKQNGLIALAFAVLPSLVHRRWAQIVGSLGVLGGAIAMGGLLLPVLFGPFLWRHVIDGVRQSLNVYAAVNLIYLVAFIEFGPLLATTLVIMHHWVEERCTPPLVRYLVATQLILWGVMAATALKDGADRNYLDEPLVLTMILAAAGLTTTIDGAPPLPGSKGFRVLGTWVALFTLTIATSQFYLGVYGRSESRSLRPVPDQTFAAFEPARAWLREGLTATPDARLMSFAFPLIPMMADRVIIPQRELAENALSKGMVDYGTLVRMAHDGTLRFIVSPAERPLPARYLGMDFQPYVLVKHIDGLNIYEWQSR